MLAHQRFDPATRRSVQPVRVALYALLLTMLAVGAQADTPIASVDGTVRALVVLGNDLIAGGDFTTAGGVPAQHIARWDGQEERWYPLGSGTNAPVRALAAFQGRLFVGGDFTEAGSQPANHVATWEDGSWSALGSGTNGPVNALATLFGLFVYAGGSFDAAGGVAASNVAEWFDGAWRPMGDGLNGSVEAMTMRENTVIAVGEISAVGNPAERKIVSFSPLGWIGQHDFIEGKLVHAVAYVNGTLVMGGEFSEVWLSTPGFSVARKVGPRWLTLGYGLAQGTRRQPGEVFAMTEYAGGIAAGGRFSLADGSPADNVAFHGGSGWLPLAAGVDGTVLALTEYGTDLIVGGSFTTAGGLAATNIARWDGGAWSNDLTPVALDDLRVNADADGVHLSWRLPTASLRTLRRVAVQRAAHAEGPFVRRSDELFPEPQMSWRDTAVEPNSVYWYRLRLDSIDGTPSHAGTVRIETTGPESAVDLLSALDPGQGLPVQIRYRLGQTVEVHLEIFDPRGRAVRLIESGLHAPGEYVRTWDRYDAQGRPAPRGVYFVYLGAGETRSSRRLVLLSH